MSDKNVIISGIQVTLDNMLKKTKEATSKELGYRRWWTKQVMTALCLWGFENLKRGFWIGASRTGDTETMKKCAEHYGGKFQGEWLYDLIFLEYDDHGCLERTPLVAECEWGNKDEIDDDFQKLLVARANVRVMIFNGNHYRTEGKSSIELNELEVFTDAITNCKHTKIGDTYLFAARLHGDGIENHKFDYHTFVV